MRWYQVDPSWYAIWLLEKLGLARNVRRVPRPLQQRKLKKGSLEAADEHAVAREPRPGGPTLETT